jgi:hypothetical protein
MSNVISKENPSEGIKRSVHTNDYSKTEFWHNITPPNCKPIYWKNSNGSLVEMNSTEKKNVDDAIAEKKERQNKINEIMTLCLNATDEEINAAKAALGG